MTIGLDLPDLLVDQIHMDGDLLIIAAHTQPAKDRCPDYDQLSGRVHSRYTRTLDDLPWQGKIIRLHLTSKRFFCLNRNCPRKIFTQRLPLLAQPYARTTQRLEVIHFLLGWALGGNPAARLAQRLGAATSADTLLRRVKEAFRPDPAPRRIIGVDDWAWCNGQRYGTILVDHESGEVLDLLPDRDSQTLQTWLKNHPEIEIITRDRSGSYTQAASQALPHAQQIADRWHLLKNVREALERLLQRHFSAIEKSFTPQPEADSQEIQEESTHENCSEDQPQKKISEVLSPSQQRRQDRYQQVRQAFQEGKSICQIAKEMDLGRDTVRRYLRQDSCPDWRGRKKRPGSLKPYHQAIDDRIAQGSTCAAEIHRELVEQGYSVSYYAIRRFVSKRLAAAGIERPGRKSAKVLVKQAPSARQLAFAVIRREEERSEEEREQVERLHSGDSGWQEGVRLVESFAAMIGKESEQALGQWLQEAEQSEAIELQEFAKVLRQDQAAVEAAMTEPWSNGRVEGQVNRLKMIKRQMYGRAGFELLRARVCKPRAG